MPLLQISAQERESHICDYLQFVRPIACALHRQFPGSDLDDLIQIGALGLIAAIDRDDGRRTRSFAKWYIRGAILNSLGQRQRGLRILGEAECSVEHPAARYELQEALESLPEMEREILLRRIEGYSRREIAQSIQMSAKQVQGYELRAVNFLKRREHKLVRAA